MSEYKEQIKEFILEWWDNPSKEDMNHFIYGRDSMNEIVELEIAFKEMESERKILYDDKHDCWLWLQQVDEDKYIKVR